MLAQNNDNDCHKKPPSNDKLTKNTNKTIMINCSPPRVILGGLSWHIVAVHCSTLDEPLAGMKMAAALQNLNLELVGIPSNLQNRISYIL